MDYREAYQAAIAAGLRPTTREAAQKYGEPEYWEQTRPVLQDTAREVVLPGPVNFAYRKAIGEPLNAWDAADFIPGVAAIGGGIKAVKGAAKGAKAAKAVAKAGDAGGGSRLGRTLGIEDWQNSGWIGPKGELIEASGDIHPETFRKAFNLPAAMTDEEVLETAYKQGYIRRHTGGGEIAIEGRGMNPAQLATLRRINRNNADVPVMWDLGDEFGEGIDGLTKAVHKRGITERYANVAKAGKGLDMSDAARMARADELYPIGGYHGTGTEWYKEADAAFDPKKLGSVTNAPDAKAGAFFFHNEPVISAQYAKEAAMRVGDRGKGYVFPARLRMQKPHEIDMGGAAYNERTFAQIIKDAKAAGKDGVIFRNVDDSLHTRTGMGDGSTTGIVYAVFDPAQIRRLEAAFDPKQANSPRLLASIGGALIVGAGAAGMSATEPASDAR
jgi:hypothetical protein